MAINEVRVYAVPLETVARYTMSSSSVSTPVSTIVSVHDSSGAIGFGEVCMASPHYQSAHNAGIRAALELLAPAILGSVASHHERMYAAMNHALDGNAEARAVLDIACWDLHGKLTNSAVVDLLGGARMEDVSTYHVIGIDTADAAAQAATELQDDGHVQLQLKAGGRPVDADIDSIRAVAAVRRPGVALAVDANRGWTVSEALTVSKACADLQLSLEQPCATEAELQRVRADGSHPIIVDENATDLPTIARMITTGLASGFGLKISRLGGLTPMRAVRDLCMATRTPMSSDDAWGGDIIAAAGVALGATLEPQLSRGAWIAHPYHGMHYDDANGPRLDGGHVTLPSGAPGLGLVLEPDQFGAPTAVYV